MSAKQVLVVKIYENESADGILEEIKNQSAF